MVLNMTEEIRNLKGETMKIQSANQVTGAAAGVMVFAGFGAAWMFLALYVRQSLSVGTAAWIAPGFIVLMLGAVLLRREAGHYPRVTKDSAMMRTFLLANLAEWAGLFAVFFTLPRLHLDNYVFSGAAVVIGLHFFPLGRIFRSSTHYGTGAVLVAWAAISAAFLPAEHMPSDTGFGIGTILWLGGAVVLVRMLTAARKAELQTA